MPQGSGQHLGQRRLPAWLALLLVLLLGGGAVWGILKQMGGEKRGVETVAIDPPAQKARRSMGVVPERVGPEQAKVFKRPDGVIRVSGERCTLFLDPADKGGEINLEYADPENWLTRQQLAVLRIAERGQQSRGRPRGVELTDEQRRQSKLVTADPLVPMDDSDRDKLEQLVGAWESASDAQKPAAQNALLEELRQVVKKNEKTARRAFVANIEKFAAMLTPQQMEQYRQMDNGPPRRTGRNG
ncbi:MAG TPA: hypothetical protein VGP99_12370 [Tepidisphaeraceae bacterium]|jgi:hypothetical protein|nr:hypothetical protein [Tepidisphaeraceae bacterium]